jgi:adenine/guanine phosphoribosyltransferase-like PRPP-binding protein
MGWYNGTEGEKFMRVKEMDDNSWRRVTGGYIGGSSHTSLLLNHNIRNKIIMECVGRLRSVDHDCIVVCGTSGLMVGPQVCEILQKNLVIVRKKDERSYSNFGIEGAYSPRFVILDDLICSGSTIQHILRTINNEYYRMECLGAYFYLQDQCAYQNCPEKFVTKYNINYL